MARVVSWGGNVVVIGPAAALVCVVLYRRDWRSAALVGLSTLGAAVIFNVDKLVVARPRPPVSHLAPVVHSSFPSGHATMSAAFYLALLIVFHSHRHARIVTIVASTAATLTILAIGFARVYLGVHYLSDVAAGTVLGATWAGAVALCLGSSGTRGPQRGRTPRAGGGVPWVTTAADTPGQPLGSRAAVQSDPDGAAPAVRTRAAGDIEQAHTVASGGLAQG
jgi:undecaprenyl-diphosphatase